MAVSRYFAVLIPEDRLDGEPAILSRIRAGEREAVIEYFDLCAKFWRREGGRIERWKDAVRRGETPTSS